jgi:hypothetical protein
MPSLVKGLLSALGILAIATPPFLAAIAVDWTSAETGLVTAEAVTAVALVSALVAHVWPATKEEPVAVATAVTAWATATLALVTGFGWWDLTEEQIATVLSFVTAVVNAIGALIARGQVKAQTTGE